MCCVFNCACAGTTPMASVMTPPTATHHEADIRRTGTILPSTGENRIRGLGSIAETRPAVQLRVHGRPCREDAGIFHGRKDLRLVESVKTSRISRRGREIS